MTKTKEYKVQVHLKKSCLVWMSVIYIGEGEDGKVGGVHIAEECLERQAEKLCFDSMVL